MAYLNIIMNYDLEKNVRSSELIFLMACMTSLQVSGKQLTHKISNVARPALRRLGHVNGKIEHSACIYVKRNSVGRPDEENIFYLKK
jgi:hypothetical protein